MEEELCESGTLQPPPLLPAGGTGGRIRGCNSGLAVCAAPTSPSHSCRRAWMASSRSW